MHSCIYKKSLKNTYPTVWHLDFAILLTWQKERKNWHICQTCSHLALENWREVINAKPLEIASFHLCHIFLRLGKLPHLPNQLCKTVGDALSIKAVEKDVVVEGVAAEGEEDQVPPAGVGRRLGLEDGRDQEPDVLDTPGLVVKLRHEWIGRIVLDDRGVRHAGSGRSGGCGSSPSSVVLSPGACWFTATTSVRCTSPPTLCSTSRPNIWRSIYTLSVIKSPSAMFGSSTSRPPPSSPTSSPRASRPRPSPSFAPISTSPVASCVCGGLVCVLLFVSNL